MATTGARRVFVDTNVLIRATINRAPLHAEARAHLDRLWDEGAALYISQQVLREYMVNTTRAGPPAATGRACPGGRQADSRCQYRRDHAGLRYLRSADPQYS